MTEQQMDAVKARTIEYLIECIELPDDVARQVVENRPLEDIIDIYRDEGIQGYIYCPY